MPSIYDLKPRFQALLRPLMHGLARAGITPNGVTLAAVVGSIVVGVVVAGARPEQPPRLLLLPVWLFARMALNALDGMMARELNRQSRLGAVLNEVGDVVADTALYLPLALVQPGAAPSIVAFTLGALLTEFCGVLGLALGGERRYEGPMGKSDRAFLVGLTALVGFCMPRTLDYWPWIFGTAAALSLLTAWNRLRKTLA